MKTLKTMMMAIAMLLMAAPAMADEDGSCMSDQDCPDGYGCVMMACACADCPPCPPGEECEDCPPCDCPEEGEGWCEYLGDDDDDWGFYGGECDVDGDCPMGFSCEMVQVPCATNPTCPPCDCMGCDPDDEDCEDMPCECPECPEPEPCEPEEMGVCVYDMMDCESDSECGEGFECLEVEECWGSGSSGGCACPPCACETCVDGEECEPCECEPCECDDEPEEFEEGCEVVGSFCAPKEQPCETDDECLDGWECMMVSMGGGGTDCACPGCACEPCAEGEECEPCDCPPCECDEEPEEWIEEEGYCVPDGWSEIIEDAGGVAGSGSYEEARDAMAGEIWGDENSGGEDKDLQLSTPEAAGGTGDDGADLAEATGCSTGNAAGAAPMMILLFALVGLAILPRRRSVTTR